MKLTIKIFGTAVLAGLLAATSASAQKKYDKGASDDEIKIGQTAPYSGPASAWGAIGRVEAAYFKMINETGGVNGRKITLISYDDAYNPAKTVEQTRRLVESDGVLAIFQTLGTANGAAVQKYLNDKKIPQIYVASGAARFTDPNQYPWTIGYNPSYRSEARIYARYILEHRPNAKIGVLYQNDDFGKELLSGLKEGLGAQADSMIVAQASYEITDTTIDAQMVKLQISGADTFVDISAPKFASQAIKKAAEMGWTPLHILNINASSLSVMVAAGKQNGKDIISATYGKDPADPRWDDDPGMKRYKAFMMKNFSEAEINNTFNSYAYSVAQLMVKTLELCGDELTREKLMNTASNLKNLSFDLSLPGATISSTPTDYQINKQFQMIQFDGIRWNAIGGMLTDEMGK